MKTLATLFLTMAVNIGASSPPADAGQREIEMLTGAVIAYDHMQSLAPCYHICGGSVIVLVDGTAHQSPRYIRVDFKYPDRKFPDKLVESKARYRLRLERSASRDSPLVEFIPMLDERTGEKVNSNLLAWKLIPGAENERLPFGETLPAYSLANDASKLKKRK